MGEGFVLDDRNIKINLIGKIQPTQVYHTCDKCAQPIVYYGRMIPCKHIFCFDCACKARETDQNCPRCRDPVQRIEKCPRGAVFVCRIPNCRRTYLSQRDLTAHIRHRHKANEAVAQGLQIELPGTDGGTPVAPPAQPTQPPPTTNNPPSNPGPPIHSGQSGYPGHGSGGFNDYPARNYPDRDSRGPPSGRKPPPQTSGWPQDPPAGYRDGERSRGGRGRGGHSDRGRGGYKDGYGGGRPISQGQWGPR